MRVSSCKSVRTLISSALLSSAHSAQYATNYKFFTYKNTYRYIDALQDFVAGYNATVHSSTGMTPESVTDSDVLGIWKRMQSKQVRVRIKKAKYSVGQHVRISNK